MRVASDLEQKVVLFDGLVAFASAGFERPTIKNMYPAARVPDDTSARSKAWQPSVWSAFGQAGMAGTALQPVLLTARLLLRTWEKQIQGS
jgi:hypothetical protein